jgi:1-acyl-sn-glycerol-3-phosphate acyltransferase
MSPVVWRIGKIILGALMFLLGPVRVYGKRNVPRSGGLLILANHISDADPPALGHAIQRIPRFMAKSELFQMRILGPLIRLFGGFPVRRGAPDRNAIRIAVEILQSGGCVAMFPEGEVSETGEPQPILPGAAMIVRRSQAKVICAGIRGTRRIIPYRSILPRPAFGGVSVHFGEPRQFSDERDEEILAWIDSELRKLAGKALEAT